MDGTFVGGSQSDANRLAGFLAGAIHQTCSSCSATAASSQSTVMAALWPAPDETLLTMPTSSEYRGQLVGTLTRLLNGEEPYDVNINVTEAVAPDQISAFVSSEITKAVGGVGQLVMVLLDYLVMHATEESLTQAEWLSRAAVDAAHVYDE